MALPAKTKEPSSRLRLVHDSRPIPDHELARHESGAHPTLSRLRAEEAKSFGGRSLVDREDGELVALCLAGQSSAFEVLYRRHSPYAMALGVRVQGSPIDIEDIVHDAFLRVHDRLESLRDSGSFRPWLASVVVSLVRSRLRKRRMLTLLGLSTADPIDLDSIVSRDAGPEVRAQIAQVYGVLQRVPVDHGICWTLRYVEGRKLEDVAEIAQCSLATAKRRIAAVQQKILLLEAVRPGWDEPPTSGRYQAGLDQVEIPPSDHIPPSDEIPPSDQEGRDE